MEKPWLSAYRYLEHLFSFGHISGFGVANVDYNELWSVLSEREVEHLPQVVVNWMNITNPQTDVRYLCDKYHIRHIAYGLLAYGAPQAIKAIASRMMLPWASLMLAWAVSKSNSVIVRATSAAHREENLKRVHLAPEDIAELDGLSRIRMEL